MELLGKIKTWDKRIYLNILRKCALPNTFIILDAIFLLGENINV